MIATESFWVATKDGRGRQITAGSVFDSGDDAVKTNPHLFQTVEDAGRAAETPTFAAVEQATAAPGEQRETARSNEGPTKGLTTDDMPKDKG